MTKLPIIDKCEGCSRIENIDGGQYCKAYINPTEKWKLGDCPLCSTIRKMEGNQQEKQRVGQQKQKKKKKL